jgi:hypothetical protein
MEELELFGRTLKLDDGEIYSLKNSKNPYWRKIKPTSNKDGYYRLSLYHNNKQKSYLFHRIIYKFHNRDWDITDTRKNNQIDHIDNCRNNNNIENLRLVNSSENSQNRSKTKGYCWNEKKGKWRARITINNKVINLGYYDTEEEARAVYLKGKEKYHTH